MSKLSDNLAQYFNPDGYATFTDKGRMSDERRPANGSDSTMIVFRDTDGHNSIRALTFNEIVDALKELGYAVEG